jgi:hypothetical protein
MTPGARARTSSSAERSEAMARKATAVLVTAPSRSPPRAATAEDTVAVLLTSSRSAVSSLPSSCMSPAVWLSAGLR